MPQDPESLNRYTQALKFEDFIISSGIALLTSSPEKRHEFIQDMSGDRFISILQQMNAVILDRSEGVSPFTAEFNFMHPRDPRRLFPDIMPAPEDKEELIKDVLAHAQTLDDPEQQAVVIGFGITAIHPFLDGNGRLARAMYLLLSRDFEPGQPDLYRALDKKGDNTAMLSADILTPAVFDILKKQFSSHDSDGKPKFWPMVEDPIKFLTAEEITTPRRAFDDEQFQYLKAIFVDENVGPILAYLIASKTTFRTVRSAIHQMPRGTAFRFDEFITNASDLEMAKAFEFFREVKRQHIRVLLNLLTDENAYNNLGIQHPDRPPGQTLSVKKFGRLVAGHMFQTKFLVV